jgi:hypothetical protein
MSDHQGPEAYRRQARLWQEKADALSHGEERDVCLVIADGYAGLAALMEQQVVDGKATGSAPGTDVGDSVVHGSDA